MEAPFGQDDQLNAAPMLIDAHPFELIHFSAPTEKDEVSQVRLEASAVGLEGGKFELRSIPEYPLAIGTSLQIFDISHSSRPADDEQYGPPVEGSSIQLCTPGAWTLGPEQSSSEMLLVVSPGDLDTTGEPFELQFDRALKPLAAGAVVATLEDDGPMTECGGAAAAPPVNIPVDVELKAGNSRLVVTPRGSLPAGHRFVLEIDPNNLVAVANNVPAWSKMPRRFEFGTRAAADHGLGGLNTETPLGPGSPEARDMVQLGHVMIVGADNGELVAFDVSNPTGEAGYRRLARLDKGLQGTARAMATDGHGRVFWAGLYGSLWAIRSARIEDIENASGPCAAALDWAADTPCFEAREGSVRIAFSPGGESVTPSEWLSYSTLPTGTPMDLELLVQDEHGAALDLEAFLRAYIGGELQSATADERGVFTFDVPVMSTVLRAKSGQAEPSLPDGPAPPPVDAWRDSTCAGEQKWDRYQRVTVDNLTTGESWSVDVENPDYGSGTGAGTVSGVRARRGDRLQVRYNLRTLGYVALMGSGITVVDLNRAYRAPSPGGGLGDSLTQQQCGRRLGAFEGAAIEFPSCASDFGSAPEGLALTPSLALESKTCSGDQCRGEGTFDVFSPLLQVGVIHSQAPNDRPAGLQANDLAACIRTVANQRVMLRDVAVADESSWIDYGLRGDLSGHFNRTDQKGPISRNGDLLFVTLGPAGVFVFDTSKRTVHDSLIGLLRVPGHTAYRVQVDRASGLVFVGGTDDSSFRVEACGRRLGSAVRRDGSWQLVRASSHRVTADSVGDGASRDRRLWQWADLCVGPRCCKAHRDSLQTARVHVCSTPAA